MTLKEAAPYFPIIPLKPNYTELHEDLDRDPSEMTIGELHKHRFYLETKILETGPDTCTICRIIIGSVTIIWQIHVDHAYQAHSRLKKLHSQTLLQPIRFMSIPEMEIWEGLPFLWHGQDMGEIGPIESSTCVRHEPYPLPHGFEWSVLDSSNFNEIIQFHNDHNSTETNHITRRHLKWLISSPLYKKGCLLGIRSSSSKNLVCYIACTPYYIRIGGKLLSMVNLPQHALDAENNFYNIGIKEAMRMFGHEGIFQATIATELRLIPKSVITQDIAICL